MMYIKLTDDMDLVVTVADTIYRGDNLSKAITFLIPDTISNVPTESTTIFLSYIRADGEPDMDILKRSTQMYSGSYYQYTFPVTCKMSMIPGQVVMWLQICSGDLCNPVIAKSNECSIRIHKSKSLDDCMSDCQLTAIYKLQKAVDELAKGGMLDEDSDSWGDMDDTDDSDTSGNESWEDI